MTIQLMLNHNGDWCESMNFRLGYQSKLFQWPLLILYSLRYPHRPHVVVTADEFPTQVALMVDDPEAPGGKRFTIVGASDNLVNALARKMNFT
ncbi:hypothetical protein Pmani_018425 [Petrolisthes manimaculis]|uniref:Uncharacterized protein n=1 Tax=Petrolisthes manimaculis TaxID=1843537 RepID=A0AAE1PKD2_9EUCA|nr:hypothetical protein Pmani_018425 [Petrolisthes manimaculis]